RSRFRGRPPAEGVCQAGKDSTCHVSNRDGEQQIVMKEHQQVEKRCDENQDLKWMPAAKIEVLETVKTPLAHHNTTDRQQQANTKGRQRQVANRFTPEEMDSCGNHARSGGNRHSHKIFSPRASGIRRLGIYLDVEPRQTAGASNQENEGRDESQLDDAVMNAW